MTPLYSNVALWMGSLMLAIMIRVEVDATGIGRIRRWQGYLGRYLLFGTIAILQGIVITAGDLVTGIKVVNIPAFLFSGIVQGFVYSSIVYALTVCFQHIGKAIAILLIIMQIPGSAGVYPIEMMPQFYQDLRPWLPWTYGISLMREAIGGMYRLTYGHDILILLVYSAFAFFFGLVLRGPMANLNLLMDERLSQTDFFNTENGVDLPKPRVRLTTVVRALIGRPEWRQRVVRRAVAFDKAYPKLIRAAAVVTILVPFLPFAFIASPNEKLATMGLWVVVILLAVAFVVIIEYVHRSLGREVGLSRLSPEQLQALMSEKEGR
jgi:putative membrane protein